MGLQLCKGGGEGEDGGLELDKAARLHNSSHTTPTHCGCTHVSAIELLDPIVQCGVCCVQQCTDSSVNPVCSFDSVSSGDHQHQEKEV